MQNKYIFHIIIANILWSLIPIIVVGLFNELSIFLIIIIRFFWAGIALFGLAIILVHFNNKNPANSKLGFAELFDFIKCENKNFFGWKNLYYYAIMGFIGIVLQIVWFFFAIKTTSIAFAMIGFIISIIIVAIYEHEVRSEKLDVFKILYLTLLVFSIGIIIFIGASNNMSEETNISSLGILYVILFSICLSFFQLITKRDSYTTSEIKIINKNPNYKIPRLLIKISITFLFGTILLIPFLLLFSLIPIETDFSEEINLLWAQFLDISLVFRWEIIFLIIFATILPYILVFISQVKWTPFNLTFSQWTSILTIIEPIGTLFFGFLLINEDFPLPFLIIVLFLLIMAILFRYAHESINKVNAYILIEKKPGILSKLPLKLVKLDGVCCVNSLIGTHDLLVHVKTNSISKLYSLVDSEIRPLEGIIEIKILFIKKINKHEL